MPNNNFSQLDPPQIIQNVHDQTTGTLKAKISNNYDLTVNPDGSLNAVVETQSGYLGAMTMGSQGMGALINKFIGTVTFNEVQSTAYQGKETLNFLNNGLSVAGIYITQTASGWDFLFSNAPVVSGYLLLENGLDRFLLEDSSGDILLG